jgi:hypothetical protein
MLEIRGRIPEPLGRCLVVGVSHATTRIPTFKLFLFNLFAAGSERSSLLSFYSMHSILLLSPVYDLGRAMIINNAGKKEKEKRKGKMKGKKKKKNPKPQLPQVFHTDK